VFDGVRESISKDYIVCLKRKKNLHARNIIRGAVNTQQQRRFRKYFCVFPLFKMSLRVTVHKAPDGSLDTENTK
jgi:hypothetical protein